MLITSQDCANTVKTKRGADDMVRGCYAGVFIFQDPFHPNRFREWAQYLPCWLRRYWSLDPQLAAGYFIDFVFAVGSQIRAYDSRGNNASFQKLPLHPLEIHKRRHFSKFWWSIISWKNNPFSLAARKWKYGFSHSVASSRHFEATGLVGFFVYYAWSRKRIRRDVMQVLHMDGSSHVFLRV